MQQLESNLKKNRPNISLTSIRTYLSTLKNLYNKTKESGDELTPKYFIEHQDRILNHLKDVPPSTRKSKLAPLIIICGLNPCIEKYRSLMMEDVKAYDEEQKDGHKSQKQKENWISQEEVLQIYHKLEKDVAPLWKKIELTKAEFNRLQDYVLLSLYVLNPPRRILDYTEMKLRDINVKEDNYIKGKKFIFNRYKTQKSYGTQEVDISPKLYTILNKWKRVNPYDYLLVDNRHSKLSQPQMTLKLNSIFGRNISVNLLRHIFISEELAPEIEKLKKTAEEMGHDSEMQAKYVKK